MGDRPRANWAQIVSAFVGFASIGGAIANEFKEEKGVILTVVFGGVGIACAVWFVWSFCNARSERKKSAIYPLAVDLKGTSSKYYKLETSERMRRIRVRNETTDRSIKNISVKIHEHPPQLSAETPGFLRRMHGEMQPFDLNPESEEFVELVALAKGDDHFRVCYHNPNVPARLKAEMLYTFVVRVTANDIPTREFHFSVERDGSGELLVKSAVTPPPRSS